MKNGISSHGSHDLAAQLARPTGIRTPVTAVKGRCPGPLDEGREFAGGIKSFAASGKAAHDPEKWLPVFGKDHAPVKIAVRGYHLPVLGIDFHGSRGGLASPFCSNSIECLSGERTKAMTPSRGGRLMVTPAFISVSQVA